MGVILGNRRKDTLLRLDMVPLAGRCPTAPACSTFQGYWSFGVESSIKAPDPCQVQSSSWKGRVPGP